MSHVILEPKTDARVALAPVTSSPRSITGIEWLRALASVGVVLWHVHAIGGPLLKPPENGPSLADLANYQVLLTAVPVFMAISCYLFAIGGGTLSRRLPRIFLLLAFWPVALKVWLGSAWSLPALIPKRPLAAVQFLLTAGDTIYYFFVSLVLCLLLSGLAKRLGTQTIAAACGLSCLATAMLPLVAHRSGWWSLDAYWCPLNFVAYPFASELLARSRMSGRRSVSACVLLLVGVVAAATLEWSPRLQPLYIRGADYSFPANSKLSVILTAYLALIAALALKPRMNPLIRYVAANSLALYCLHPFVTPIWDKAAKKLPSLQGHEGASALAVIAASYAAAHVLRRFLRKELLA